jgi:hypothetical protein
MKFVFQKLFNYGDFRCFESPRNLFLILSYLFNHYFFYDGVVIIHQA